MDGAQSEALNRLEKADNIIGFERHRVCEIAPRSLVCAEHLRPPRSKEYTGVSTNNALVVALCTKVRDRGVRFVQSSWGSLPFADAGCDVVLFSPGLEPFPDEVMPELVRVLRSRGFFVILEPYWGDWLDSDRRFVRIASQGLTIFARS
jgi:SAM-dependent methyltransferase